MQTILFFVFVLIVISITGGLPPMFDLIFVVVLIALGFTTGTMVEKRHFRSLRRREEETVNLNVSSLLKKFPQDKMEVDKAFLVTGSAVISMDYFKYFLASLINLFGGAVIPYETLLDRARREAVLRMKDEAKGADFIINARIETSNIGAKSDRGTGCVEALAYGTAIFLRK